jgi:hypothetical protein
MFFLILAPWLLLAQKQEVRRFGAVQLNAATYELLGDSTAWPLVVRIAERNEALNEFILNREALSKLHELRLLLAKVRDARENLRRQIKGGARVFASDELAAASELFRSYDVNVSSGNVDGVIDVGGRIPAAVAAIGKIILDKRTEAIDAKLEQKTGIVDKRKGVLGSWQTAFIGDLFAAYDAVKTGELSQAQLVFVDGVDVMIDPNTIVLIRSSQLDKLDQTVKRELALVNGGILTKLSPRAREVNDFRFEAGTSQSIIKSGKFWASAIQDKRVKLSNYDGRVDLKANNVSVILQSNEGTIVEKGKAPLKPIKLLEAPQLIWSRLDSVIYSEKLMLTWLPVAGAASYQVEVSPRKDFGANIKRLEPTGPNLQLTGIPLAVMYVRLQAIDRYGLRGIDSPVYTIVRNRDTQPPPIYLDGWENDTRYTMLRLIQVKGQTESDASLTQNDHPVIVGAQGAFSFTVKSEQPETRVVLKATDQSGNTLQRILHIIPMDTLHVASISWNCMVRGDTLTAASDRINGSGTAYPHVKVIAVVGGERSEVQTNTSGQWAVSVKAVKGTFLIMSFESLDDGVPILQKSFWIE